MPRRRHPPEAAPDFYDVLGVDYGAPVADIRRAYRALALKHHPDKVKAKERPAATKKLAAINQAWDVLGDGDRRRVYDMQRDQPGASRAGWLATCRTFLGAEARAFAWSSGMPYMRSHDLGTLHARLQRGRPAFLFAHLGGSPRSERLVPIMLALQRSLAGAVHVAALDVESEPDLARSLLPVAEDVPAALLVTAAGGRTSSRIFTPPFDHEALISEALGALPELPNICTQSQLVSLFATVRGRDGRVARTTRAAVVPRGQKAVARATRIGCAAAGASFACAQIPRANCALPSAVMACPGLALLRTDGRTRDREPRVDVQRCITNEDAVLDSLRTWASISRHGAAVGRMQSALAIAADTGPVRATAAIGGAVRSTPWGKALAKGTVWVAAGVQTHIPVVAAGLAVWLARSIAIGGIPWASRRGARGGRKLGRAKRRQGRAGTDSRTGSLRHRRG